MMRLTHWFVLLLFIFSIPAAAQQTTCEGGLVPRLNVDGYGKVTEGDANNVRDAASRNGELIGQIEGGSPFTVLDGFTCTGNFTWWQVEYFDGSDMVTGWTAESNGTDYFLEPITDENFVLFRNLSFTLPASLAGEVVTETQDFTETTSIEITFPDYEAMFEVGADAEIRIFSAEAGDNGDDLLDQWEGGFGYAYYGLIEMLETRPDLLTFSAGRNDIPDLSPGVAPLTLAQRQYLDFKSGSGYRFLSAYAQMDVSVNNGNLRYRYQGLTADENYLVDVTFAVDAPANPPRYVRIDAPTDTEEFEHSRDYGEQVAVFYDAIAPEAFTPSLLDLDALIASIEVR
jgi:hypothetical protein